MADRKVIRYTKSKKSKPVPVPREPTLAEIPRPLTILSPEEKDRIDALVAACDNDGRLLLLLNAYKQLGYNADSDPKYDMPAKCLNFFAEFATEEELEFIGKFQTLVMPYLRTPTDWEKCHSILTNPNFTEETFADAVAIKRNFGRRVDFPEALRLLMTDTSVPVAQTVKVVELANNNVAKVVDVTVGKTTFSAHCYGFDPNHANDVTHKFTPKTYPSSQVKIEETIAQVKKFDVRQSNYLSPIEHQLLHFLVSQLVWENKSHRLSIFTPRLERQFLGSLSYRREPHRLLLDWLIEHLQPKIKGKDKVLNEINELTLMSQVDLKEFKQRINLLKAEMKDVFAVVVPRNITIFQKMLTSTAFSNFYFAHKDDTEAGFFALKVLEMARAYFPEHKIPEITQTPDEILEALKVVESESRDRRLNRNFTHDRLLAEGYGEFLFNTSTVNKGVFAYDNLLRAEKMWSRRDTEPRAFVHIGTTKNNFTDLSCKLQDQMVPVYRFDLEEDIEQGIGKFDIDKHRWPSVLTGLDLYVFDDVFMVKEGKKRLPFTHGDHNELLRAKTMAYVRLLEKNPNVKALSMKFFFPAICNAAKGKYKFNTFFDHLLSIVNAGKFDRYEIDCLHGRPGNSEIFVTFMKLPPNATLVERSWGREPPFHDPKLGEEENAAKFFADRSAVKLKILGMYAYVVGISVLRTLGYGLWCLAPLRDTIVGSARRGKLQQYQSESIIIQKRVDVDPLEEFLNTCNVKFAEKKEEKFPLDTFVDQGTVTKKQSRLVWKALEKLLMNTKGELKTRKFRVDDLFHIWVSQTKMGAQRLFTTTVVEDDESTVRVLERNYVPVEMDVDQETGEEENSDVELKTRIVIETHEESVDPEEQEEHERSRSKGKEEEDSDGEGEVKITFDIPLTTEADSKAFVFQPLSLDDDDEVEIPPRKESPSPMGGLVSSLAGTAIKSPSASESVDTPTQSE